jgi:hypothetical protein
LKEAAVSVSVSNDDLVLFRTVYFQGQEEMPTDKYNGLLALQRIKGVDISYRNLSWDTQASTLTLVRLSGTSEN